MGTGTLTDRASGQTILEGFWNDIHDALEGDFVGRDNSGVPASGKALGTAAFPWGVARIGSLVVGGSSVDTSQVAASPYRVVSGKTRSTSNQPQFLDPAGAAGGASVTVEGATTDLVYDVNGTTITLSSDIVKGSLSTAPSTNNTALVNDANAADQFATRTWGEEGSETNITIGTIGSEISSLDGSIAAFSVNDGSNDEAFLAYVDTTNNRLKNCFRGFFYDSSGNPVNRLAFANGDTITLLKANYLFLDSDGATVDSTATPPAYSFSAPSSPATGDYWYDLGNNLWKRYDGASFQIVTRTFIGIAVCDDTDCLYARSVDFDKSYRPDNNMHPRKSTAEIAICRELFNQISVAGNNIYYGTSFPQWSMSSDLASSADMYNATEQASTFYYLYIKDTGDEVISDISPYYRHDLFGLYHPHNPWRCIGVGFNDSGSDLQLVCSLDPWHSSPESLTVHYETNAGQSITGGSGNVVDFEDLVEDECNCVTTGASWEFLVPEKGRYKVSASILFDSASFTIALPVNIQVVHDDFGGTGLRTREALHSLQPTGTGAPNRLISTEVIANVGDKIYAKAIHNEGTARTLNAVGNRNWICIEKIR